MNAKVTTLHLQPTMILRWYKGVKTDAPVLQQFWADRHGSGEWFSIQTVTCAPKKVKK